MKSAVYEVAGDRYAIVYRAHTDCHFFSITRGNSHGSIVVSSVDERKFAAGSDDVARAAAVESETVLGRKSSVASTVVARRLAAALAGVGDFRPLTLSLNVPEPPEDAPAEHRRALALGLVAATLEVMTLEH